MGSYTAIGAPVKVVIPGPRQKTQVELPKIKLHLNKQQNAMVRLPCSTITNSQSRGSQQQVQKQKQLQQVKQSPPMCQQAPLQPVHLVNQPAQPQVTQEPQLQPVHLVKQPTQAHVTQEHKELIETQHPSEQPVQLEKTVTFADVHYDQFGRGSPIHGGSESGRSTPTQTNSGRSSPAQNIHGDHSDAIMTHRRQSSTQTNSGRSSPAQSIHGDHSNAIMTHRRQSSPTQSIQASHSTALMTHRRAFSPVKSIHGDQTVAIMPQRRPSITQLVVYQPQQQILPKTQGHHRIRIPTNKRKASLTSPQISNNMQLSLVLPNQQQMMTIPKKQVEHQQQCQAPQGYKSARKGSITGQNIVIKIVIK